MNESGGPGRRDEAGRGGPRLFGVREAGSSVRREVIGGLTTFLTMSYILVVNPGVFLAATGMPVEGAFLATALACAFATILMGLVTNLPIALAPGMGLNAFFAYNICAVYSWQAGLGVLAIVALVFLLLTVGRIRAVIMEAVPTSLRFAAAVGIGLFITLIGLQHAGLVTDHPATLVDLGNVRAPWTLLALFGLTATLILMARRVRTAIFLGMLLTVTGGYVLGLLETPESWYSRPAGGLPGLQIDLAGALAPEHLIDLLSLGVALLFFSIFDAMGTLYAVGTEAGLVDEGGRFPRLGRALTVDALGALVGAGLGTSSVTCYIESATGVSVGARTGLANVVTGVCFLASIFFMPLVETIGSGVTVDGQVYYPVTAPALIAVGILMVRSVRRIEWTDITETVPAFLTMVMMPFAFGISHGLAAGFISYTVMKLAAGRWREVHPLVGVIALLFAARYLAIP